MWFGGTQAPILSFDGVGALSGLVPPDTQGDVGPDHYVHWVNTAFAVWDKSGSLVLGPLDGNLIWTGFGGACETHNDGDPITLYDHLADRWFQTPLISEAKKGGVKTLGGMEMLIGQGAEQFRIWTGREAPLEAMLAAARR